MIVKEHSVGTELAMNNASVEDEIDFSCEPYLGLEFDAADDALKFYTSYANRMGFKVRIGQLYRSRTDGSVSSRRFVCSKEGHQLSSRTGCPAFIRVQINGSGKWVIDHFHKDHNHNLDISGENCTPTVQQKGGAAINSITEFPRRPRKKLLEEANDESSCPFGIIDFKHNYPAPRGGRQNHIRSEWYSMLLEYFQSRQAEDTGFFFAVEVDNGNCMSIFWADGRSRYSCSQFGDVLVLDTSYRKTVYLVPFATFVGVNHHKQPVLLGCALIAEESEESFTWLFQTWLRAMSGRQPLTVIADQDIAIQRAIAKVFPVTHYRFSLWQLRAKEQENMGLMGDDFTKDYEKCVYQSQTIDEFEATWNVLLNKYELKDNAWLKEMYEKRPSWVPLYLKSTFCAGIPMNESLDSFFGALLNAQTPLVEFIPRYERGLERRREEERKEDFNTSNFQPMLQTKEPVEEQCRRLYTLTVFKVFQKELLQCYSYLGFKIFEEGGLSRYLVRRCGNDTEKHVVTCNASNLSINCSCQMFEYEGVLCRHVLRVFQILQLREVPPRYILHRWTRNAEDGVFPDIESWSSSQELKSLMLWSLRETASKYIDAGATSIEKYKLAYEILREGGRKLCWHR
uniref:Protein FAR1-RELATED SEQUENCE n=1 Tax=Cajanus cajan TaxID=3821 RepID=A0A151U0F9_CAJCA|nr:Protein FAR1-RELATED SEQUENCE 7 [Cajanus cajan]